jgi:hypothetical protein
MAAGSTYTPIATYTVPSSITSYTFGSIPGTYTDLLLISSLQTSLNLDAAVIRFNSDSGSNYSYTQLRGDGTSATSNRATSQTGGRIANDCPNTGYYGTYITHIQNYANATTYKTIISRGNAASTSLQAFATLWRKTPEAITSITILPESGGNLLSGSTFTLYGIASA